jgi:hypothetical protein
LAYIWQKQHENNTNKLSTVITERRNDIEAIYSRFGGREDFTNVLSANETHMDGVRNNTPNGVLEMKKMALCGRVQEFGN